MLSSLTHDGSRSHIHGRRASSSRVLCGHRAYHVYHACHASCDHLCDRGRRAFCDRHAVAFHNNQNQVSLTIVLTHICSPSYDHHVHHVSCGHHAYRASYGRRVCRVSCGHRDHHGRHVPPKQRQQGTRPAAG